LAFLAGVFSAALLLLEVACVVLGDDCGVGLGVGEVVLAAADGVLVFCCFVSEPTAARGDPSCLTKVTLTLPSAKLLFSFNRTLIRSAISTLSPC
jgi:hypothetical protein